MIDYLLFFKEIKQFAISHKLDTESHIEGAKVAEIGEAFGQQNIEIPKAYICFLKVFGQNHAEKIFGGLDFILDSKPYFQNSAAEQHAEIALNPKYIVITEDVGAFFYFIETGSDDPPVFKFVGTNSGGRIEKIAERFTAFIREQTHWAAERNYKHKEQRPVEDWIETGRGLEPQLIQLRKDFVAETELLESPVKIIDLDTYQIRWKERFENSILYKENHSYYQKWHKPYYFKK